MLCASLVMAQARPINSKCSSQVRRWGDMGSQFC